MQEIKLTGFLLCYKTKPEMETVYKRLKDLKLPEADVKKSWNPVDVPYPWTVAVICKDRKRLDEVDAILVEKNVVLGGADSYTGELRILEFLRMLPLDVEYVPGIARIAAGECPIGGNKNLLIKVLKSKGLNKIQVDLLSSFLVGHWKEIAKSEHKVAFERILETLDPGALQAVKHLSKG